LGVFQIRRLGWWNGRHVRLRGVCRKACGFKSRPEHQYRPAQASNDYRRVEGAIIMPLIAAQTAQRVASTGN
jgi:hypothetical protein